MTWTYSLSYYLLSIILIGLSFATFTYIFVILFLGNMERWNLEKSLLSKFLTWSNLQYQFHFNRCFRDISAIQISRYFSLLKLSNDHIRIISDDLFRDDYDHEHKHFWSTIYESSGIVKTRQLLQSNVQFPLYLLEGMVPLTQARYLRVYLFLSRDWEEMCLQILEQESISLELIQSYIKWLSGLYGLPTRDSHDPVPEIIKAIINHPKVTSQIITTLCADRDPRIRGLAVASPKCTEEGRVLGALVGLAAPE